MRLNLLFSDPVGQNVTAEKNERSEWVNPVNTSLLRAPSSIYLTGVCCREGNTEAQITKEWTDGGFIYNRVLI